MNFCFHISRRLVAYGEGEVSSNERVRIEAHLDGCARCRERLRQIRQRTDLMRRLPLLDPAEELWGAIARDVSASRRPEPIKEAFVREAFSGRRGFGYRWLLRPAAITAAIFVIATGLLLTHRSGLLPGGHKGELNLAGYLDLVGMVAAAEPMLREFPAAPGFIEVSWPEARATIGFPAIAPEILPGGYKLTAARLYNLGSLRALQFKYRSEQDALCVFQLPSGSKLSFGERPSEQYQADGVHCWRARSRDCVLYRFVLGETQCALMTRQTDPAVVDALIQAFKAEAGSSQASSATSHSEKIQQTPQWELCYDNQCHGNISARSTLQPAGAPEETGLHPGCGAHTGLLDRRQRHDLHLDQGRAPAISARHRAAGGVGRGLGRHAQ